jgi:hypothetical protein
MKLTATSTGTVPMGRAARRLSAEALSWRTIARLERELVDELHEISLSDRSADADTRRDALERAVRRVWGTTL